MRKTHKYLVNNINKFSYREPYLALLPYFASVRLHQQAQIYDITKQLQNKNSPLMNDSYR